MAKKKRPVRKFTEKDAARIVAYARRDGADDKELLNYVFHAYGLSNVPCMISQSVLVLTNTFFVNSMIGGLVGLLSIVKGVKIFVTGRISKLSINPIDHFIRIKYPNLSEFYSTVLIYTGLVIGAVESIILTIDSIVDQLEYYYVLEEVCSIKTAAYPYKVKTPPPDFDLFYREDIEQKSQAERINELNDALFPPDDTEFNDWEKSKHNPFNPDNFLD